MWLFYINISSRYGSHCFLAPIEFILYFQSWNNSFFKNTFKFVTGCFYKNKSMPKNKIAIFFNSLVTFFAGYLYSRQYNTEYFLSYVYIVFNVNIYFGDFFYRPNGVKLCIFSMLYALILAIFPYFLCVATLLWLTIDFYSFFFVNYMVSLLFLYNNKQFLFSIINLFFGSVGFGVQTFI